MGWVGLKFYFESQVGSMVYSTHLIHCPTIILVFFSSSLVFQSLQDIEYVGYERKTHQPHPCQLNWVGCYACDGLD